MNFKSEKEVKMEQLIETYKKAVFSIAYSVVGGIGAEDVLSETFESIFEHLDKIIELDEQGERSYIYTIAYHKAIDYYCKEKNQRRLAEKLSYEQEVVESEKDLLEAAAGVTFGFQVDGAVERLSFDDQTVLYLQYGLRYSASEIADFFGISKEAAKKRMQRARQRVKNILVDIEKGAEGLNG